MTNFKREEIVFNSHSNADKGLEKNINESLIINIKEGNARTKNNYLFISNVSE
jgi:hypothetical protein